MTKILPLTFSLEDREDNDSALTVLGILPFGHDDGDSAVYQNGLALRILEAIKANPDGDITDTLIAMASDGRLTGGEVVFLALHGFRAMLDRGQGIKMAMFLERKTREQIDADTRAFAAKNSD